MEISKQEALAIIRLTSLCESEGQVRDEDIEFAYILVGHFKLTDDERSWLPPRDTKCI